MSKKQNQVNPAELAANEKTNESANAQVTNYATFASRGQKIVCGLVEDAKGNVVTIQRVGEKLTAQGKSYDLFSISMDSRLLIAEANSPQVKTCLSTGNYSRIATRSYSENTFKVIDDSQIAAVYGSMVEKRNNLLNTACRAIERLAQLCGTEPGQTIAEINAFYTLPSFETFAEMQKTEMEKRKQAAEAAAKAKAEIAAEKAAKSLEKALAAVDAQTLLAMIQSKLGK